MGLVKRLLNTSFICKPGTEAWKIFGNKKVYIEEINFKGYLKLTNQSPKTRLDDRQTKNYLNSVWHDESELIEIKKL